MGGDDLTPSLLRLFEDDMKSSISPACLANSNVAWRAFSRSSLGSAFEFLFTIPCDDEVSSNTNETFRDPPLPSETADLFRLASFVLEISTDLHGTLWLEIFEKIDLY